MLDSEPHKRRPRQFPKSSEVHHASITRLLKSSRLGAVRVIDTFSDETPAGCVIGTSVAGGAVRLGRDVERQISIDHGALRFQPLTTPGWGRQGIAYGPYRRAAGLVFAVSITNGHNTSQDTCIPDRFTKRLGRWAFGPEVDPLPVRLIAWARQSRWKSTLRRFRWWLRSSGKRYQRPDLNENLAVGWFTSEAPNDPLSDGCGFIMHAAEGENGELWARVGKRCLSAFRRIQNLRIYYLVALREHGAAYYAASIEGAHGLSAFPMMRPIAIDPFNSDPILYAGVHQSVLGQIGFRVDTRVHGVHIERMPEFAAPFGTAHVGDYLTGQGALAGGAGGAWRMLGGHINRTPGGAEAEVGEALAMVACDAPSGLVHALFEAGDAVGSAGLVWRGHDENNYWLLKISCTGCSLVHVSDGTEIQVANDAAHGLKPSATHSVQILDAHGSFGCYLDGERLFDAWFEDELTQGGCCVGIWFEGADGIRARDFEAHPREVPMPAAIHFDPPWRRFGERTVFADNFTGPPGPLAGRATPIGQGRWERTIGGGSVDIEVTGPARVRGTVGTPHPGRAFYTLPWDQPDFADLEVTVTPPGHRRGEKHRCRCGLVFWQDNDNYLSFTTWLDDIYMGASIALFPKRHGFEELYDAVWTMVWDKVRWGKQFRLRVSFDGNQCNVFIDDEPVMQRALTDVYPDDLPMRITRVGIAVNWEWGNDTGSTLESFTARC